MRLNFKSQYFNTIHKAQEPLYQKIQSFESELVEATFSIQFTSTKNIIDKQQFLTLVLNDDSVKNIMLNLEGDYNQQTTLFLQLIVDAINQEVPNSINYDTNVIYNNKAIFISNQIKSIQLQGKKIATILGGNNKQIYTFQNNQCQFDRSMYLYLHRQLNFQCLYLNTQDDKCLLAQIPYSFQPGQTVQISNTFTAIINPFYFCSGIKIDILDEDYEQIDLENNYYYLTIQFSDKDVTNKKQKQLEELAIKQQRNQVIKQQKIDQLVKRLQIQEKIYDKLKQSGVYNALAPVKENINLQSLQNLQMQDQIIQTDLTDEQIQQMEGTVFKQKDQIDELIQYQQDLETEVEDLREEKERIKMQAQKVLQQKDKRKTKDGLTNDNQEKQKLKQQLQFENEWDETMKNASQQDKTRKDQLIQEIKDDVKNQIIDELKEKVNQPDDEE